MIPIIAAAIGWIALPVSILRYQARTPTGVLLMSTLASFLFAGHYALIGAFAGAALTAAGGLTSFAQVLARKALPMSQRLLIAAPSIVFALYSSAITPLGFLAIMAFAASRIAETWSREKHMRVSMIGAAALWVAYAGAVGTLPVFIAEAVGLVSAGVAFWRFGFKKASSCPTASEVDKSLAA
jgi:hypothetical protein